MSWKSWSNNTFMVYTTLTGTGYRLNQSQSRCCGVFEGHILELLNVRGRSLLIRVLVGCGGVRPCLLVSSALVAQVSRNQRAAQKCLLLFVFGAHLFEICLFILFACCFGFHLDWIRVFSFGSVSLWSIRLAKFCLVYFFVGVFLKTFLWLVNTIVVLRAKWRTELSKVVLYCSASYDSHVSRRSAVVLGPKTFCFRECEKFLRSFCTDKCFPSFVCHYCLYFMNKIAYNHNEN